MVDLGNDFQALRINAIDSMKVSCVAQDDNGPGTGLRVI